MAYAHSDTELTVEHLTSEKKHKQSNPNKRDKCL